VYQPGLFSEEAAQSARGVMCRPARARHRGQPRLSAARSRNSASTLAPRNPTTRGMPDHRLLRSAPGPRRVGPGSVSGRGRRPRPPSILAAHRARPDVAGGEKRVGRASLAEWGCAAASVTEGLKNWNGSTGVESRLPKILSSET